MSKNYINENKKLFKDTDICINLFETFNSYKNCFV